MTLSVRVVGDKEVQRRLNELDAKISKKIVRRIFRAHAKKVRERVVRNLSGFPVQRRTGTLQMAMMSAPIRAASRRPRRLIRIGIAWPSRTELGIDAGDPHFYPAAVEYGHGTVPPKPFMRPAIDNYKSLDVWRITRALRAALRAERFL